MEHYYIMRKEIQLRPNRKLDRRQHSKPKRKKNNQNEMIFKLDIYNSQQGNGGGKLDK